MRRPKRLEGFSYRGPQRYLLTFCTENRRALFVHSGPPEAAIAQFALAAHHEHFAILAHCIMPDHAHLVTEGTAEHSDLRSFEKMAKQRSAYTLWKAFHYRHVWQEGFHDWVIRPDRDVLDVIR